MRCGSSTTRNLSPSTSSSNASETHIRRSLRVFSMRTSLASCGEIPAHMVSAAAIARWSVGMTMGILTANGAVEVRALR